jgi:peptidoglycan/LPS O-acetylase OafA/YrhL
MWGATVVAATAVMLVIGRWLPALPAGTAKVLAPLLAIGTISYGLYLWHLPVLWTVSELGWARTPMWWIGVITVSVGAATVSWHFVEKPAIAWARKRGTVPQPPQPAAAGTATAGQRELVRV